MVYTVHISDQYMFIYIYILDSFRTFHEYSLGSNVGTQALALDRCCTGARVGWQTASPKQPEGVLTFKVGNSETLNIKTPSFARFPTGPGCAWLHTSKSILRRRRGRGHAHHGHVPRREHGSGSLGIRGFGRVVEGEGPAWLIDFRLKECSIWNMFYIYILYVCIYEHINFYSCIFIIFIYRYRKNDIEIYSI